MKKIGVIRASYRFDGGGEIQTLNLLNALGDLGLKPSIFCKNWSVGESLRQAYEIRPFANSSELDLSEEFFEWALQAARKECTWVHGHDWIPGIDSIRLGDGLHTKFLKSMSEKSVLERWKNLLPKNVRKIALEKATLASPALMKVMTNSSMCMEEFEETYPEVASRVHKQVVYNPLPDELLSSVLSCKRPRRHKIILGFVGSGWRRKGLDILLQSFSRLKQDAFELWVVGQDRHAEHYKRLANILGCDANIRWFGPQTCVFETMGEIDVLIHPARYEPYGNVVTEALSHGCFVICSDRVGTKEFISKENGRIISFGVSCLHEAIENLPSHWSKDDCRSTVSNLTYDLYKQDLEKFFG